MDRQLPRDHQGEGVALFEALAEPPPLESPLFLVHQAARPDALRRLYELEPQPRLRFVYQGTSQDAVKHVGPLLIDRQQRGAAPHFRQGVHEGWAMALDGPELTLETADAHLKTLLWAELPSGKSLFNFALTSALAGIGGSLDASQINRLLGPVTHWAGSTDGEFWWFHRHRPGPLMEDADRLLLTPENLRHMVRHRQGRLAKALARHYDVAADTVSAWFEQCRRLGADSEAALVEGARTLAQRGHRHPLTSDQATAQLAQCADWPAALAALARIPLMEETMTA